VIAADFWTAFAAAFAASLLTTFVIVVGIVWLSHR